MSISARCASTTPPETPIHFLKPEDRERRPPSPIRKTRAEWIKGRKPCRAGTEFRLALHQNKPFRAELSALSAHRAGLRRRQGLGQRLQLLKRLPGIISIT